MSTEGTPNRFFTEKEAGVEGLTWDEAMQGLESVVHRKHEEDFNNSTGDGRKKPDSRAKENLESTAKQLVSEIGAMGDAEDVVKFLISRFTDSSPHVQRAKALLEQLLEGQKSPDEGHHDDERTNEIMEALIERIRRQVTGNL